MQVETVPIDSIKPRIGNTRYHPVYNIKLIKDSIQLFGQQRPIVVDSGNEIIAGSGTYNAMLELGYTTIDIVRSTLTDNVATAYSVADNKATDLSYFQPEEINEVLITAAANETPIPGWTESNLAGAKVDYVDPLILKPPPAPKGVVCPNCGTIQPIK